jgi:flavorubredoxin
MKDWLTIASHATLVQTAIGCMVSIGDLADRPPRPLAAGATLDLFGYVVQWLDTPHVLHASEAGVLYDATTKTLFRGDLFTCFGDFEASGSDDIVGPACGPGTTRRGRCRCIPRAASPSGGSPALDVETLALMHGPAFTGDCRAALVDLAGDFDRRSGALGGRPTS